MQKPQPVPFWTTSREGRSKAVTAEKLVNWYLAPAKGREKFPFSLMPTPGLAALVSVGDGPIRGTTMGGTLLYVVSGAKIYTVSSGLLVTEIGSIAGIGPVDMQWNGVSMLVVTDSDSAYSVDESSVTQITETGLQGAAYQEGYGIAVKRGSEQWHISAIDDMATWGALDFTSADMKPDSAIGVASVRGVVWILGATTIEKYQNTGNSTFPFERIIGDRMEIGCKSHGSVAIADDKLFWLGANKQGDSRVYKGLGAQAVPVSTPEIEYELNKEPSLQTARAFVYTQGGHTFYVLSMSGRTLVYDDTTNLWHHRQSHGLDRWRVSSYAYAFRRHIVGDYETGQLYSLDLDEYTENGDEIRREATSAPFHAAGDFATMWQLFADFEAGVGLDGSQQGDDPQLMVRCSDTYTNRWGNERTASIGKIGEYGEQARFFSLGQFAQQRTIQLAISDPVKAVITGVYASIEGMAH